jgi:hypothetical protein
MGKWGKCDFRQLQDFQKKLNKLLKVDFQKFCEDAAKELTARLLRKVILRTPVGQYPASTGKKGGTLRRGWTAKTEAEAAAGGSPNVAAFVDSLKITKSGNMYQIELINPVTYASYVEYGHRTKNHRGWVDGRFMLTISEQELESQAPQILEKKILKYLGGVV